MLSIYIPQSKNVAASLWKLSSFAYSLTKSVKYDVIHSQGPGGLLYKIYNRRNDLPTIVTNHGISHKIMYHDSVWAEKRGPRFFQFVRCLPNLAGRLALTTLLYKRADKITTVSNCCAEEMVQIYRVPRSKITVIPNGINLQEFIPCIDKEKIKNHYELNENVLMFVKPVPRKGLHLLLEALPLVLKERKDVNLIVVGPFRNPNRSGEGGYEPIPSEQQYHEFIVTKINKLNLNKNVLFLGRVKDLIALYSASEVFIAPSLYEPFGIVILEAMACRTPVIGFNTCGIPEIISNDVDGFVVKVGDIPSLAERILRLLNDKKLRLKMGLRGRRKIEKKYNWDIIAKKWRKYMT